MADPLHRQLLGQARRLARLDPRRPKQGNLRRAVSTAYYALFHYLVEQATRTMIGTAYDRRSYRDLLARAFQHETMAAACRSFGGTHLPKYFQKRLPTSFAVSDGVQTIAQVFVEAQEKRHLADYDRTEDFSRSDTLALIQQIDQAMASFSTISSQVESKFFLACLLAWSALTRRK